MHLLFCVLNLNLVGITSGFAAAYQLGADYPFNDDDEWVVIVTFTELLLTACRLSLCRARRLFALVLGVLHLSRMRKADRKGFLM